MNKMWSCDMMKNWEKNTNPTLWFLLNWTITNLGHDWNESGTCLDSGMNWEHVGDELGHVWNESGTCRGWIGNMSAMNWEHVWNELGTCRGWIGNMSGMNWGHVGDESGTCLEWIGNMSGMNWGHVWNELGTCQGWIGNISGMNRGTCLEWIGNMSGMNYQHVWNEWGSYLEWITNVLGSQRITCSVLGVGHIINVFFPGSSLMFVSVQKILPTSFIFDWYCCLNDMTVIVWIWNTMGNIYWK
jgi:hypothetical protein